MAADLSKFAGVIGDFKKDSTKENSGVWMTYGRFQYLVARSHRDNAKFFALMEQEMRPYQWAIERGNFAAIREAADALMQVVYAKTILLAIRPLGSETKLDYSWEDGAALFKELPDLWDEIFKYSNNGSNYAPDQIEADAKNS
jgi:hypothetical protein